MRTHTRTRTHTHNSQTRTHLQHRPIITRVGTPAEIDAAGQTGNILGRELFCDKCDVGGRARVCTVGVDRAAVECVGARGGGGEGPLDLGVYLALDLCVCV